MVVLPRRYTLTSRTLYRNSKGRDGHSCARCLRVQESCLPPLYKGSLSISVHILAILNGQGGQQRQTITTVVHRTSQVPGTACKRADPQSDASGTPAADTCHMSQSLTMLT